MFTPTSAHAAPTWLPAADVSVAGRNAEFPEVAVDPQGDAAAVWYRSNGANKIVQSAFRPAGSGAWEQPVNLSEVGFDSFDPQIAFDAEGDATVVWEQEESVIQSAFRPAGGAWEKPVPLREGGQSRALHLAVNESGAATAIWEHFDGTESTVEAAVRATASGPWQKSAKLGQRDEPAVAIDPQADAVAVWSEIVENIGVVVASFRPGPFASWGEPVVLSAKIKGQDANLPRVGFDGKGDAVAEWQYFNGAIDVVQSAVRLAASGIWQAPVRVSAAGVEVFDPTLASDPHGDVIAGWDRNVETVLTVQAAVRPAASGIWQEPVSISAEGAAKPEFSIDQQGNAVATWDRFNGSNFIIQAAVRSAASGAWGEPVNLSAVGENALEPQTAVDPQGNAVAVWERSNGSKNIVQGAGYDAAGPLLLGTSIPATGVAGQPLSFAVSPLDVWSPIGPTEWSFGDGTSAGGTSVSHTYATAGTYQVALSSTDALGNPASTGGSVTIAPAVVHSAPPPAPPVLRPAISGAKLTNRRFRVAKPNTAISARRAPLGTSFRFSLSAASRMRIAITATAPGLRRGRSCVAPTAKLRRAHARRCARTLQFGALTRSLEPQGAGRVAFSGRIGSRPLRAGSYQATLTASDVAGRSAPVTLSFRVVR